MTILQASSRDEVTLCYEVTCRLLELRDLVLRITGKDIAVPPEMTKTMTLFDQMARRHQKGDFRHSDDEWIALKEIAQWSVDLNCKMRNQQPKQVQWSH